MNKNHFMTSRNFTGTDPEQAEILYTVEVNGGRVWLHREWEEEWDNEHGSGPDTGHDCWVMSVDDLKKFIACASGAIKKSEACEASQPHSESK